MKQRADGIDLFAGDDEMSRLMRAHDWSATPLGPANGWPQSLKVALRILLGSRYAMWLGWGPDFTFFYNDAYARMTLGAKHPWALGRSAREVWAEIWSDIGPRAELVVRTGRATWDERLLLFLERRGFPEETYHTFSYSPVPDDSGGVGGMLCVVTEETERAIGERRLKALRELAARTTEEARSAEDACQTAVRTLAADPHDLPFALLYLTDAEARTARLAGAAGLEPGTAPAPSDVDLTAPPAPEGGWPLRAVLETGRAELVTDIGRWLGPPPVGVYPEPPHTAAVLPLRGSGQEGLAGFLVAGVSPRRPFDDDYRGFLDLLAGQIASALANARAYEGERRRAEALAELDRAKTAFFSNVSHEFRTPLTLMLGPVEDALAETDGALPPPQRERLEMAHRNGLRLQRLVNTLLDFSRIEAGRVQASYEPVDLAALTADLASNFRSACEKAGLVLRVDCPPLPEPVYADRDMWEKIVLNLVSNAFKYTLEGQIEVRLRPLDARVELAVRDTGTGIPAEAMPRLFERFHRVEGAGGRTQEGSGIGLALVRELVKLHGGEVRAASELGKGSVFTVTLPLGRAHLPTDRISAARTLASTALGAAPYVEEALRWLPGSEESGLTPSGEPLLPDATEGTSRQPAPAPGGRPCILLADDNADMRDYVRRLLADRYDVRAVADGQAAWVAAQQAVPDLVLSDVMMPGLDGFGLLRRLRADPRTREVPVILLSARAGEESRLEGLEAGADDYLIKPFTARELLARVQGHLQLARLRREAGAALATELEAITRLHALSTRLLSADDLPTALGDVLENAILTVGADFGNIQLYNPRTEALEIVAHRGFRQDFLDYFRTVRVDGGSACAQAMQSGERIILEDVDLDPAFEPHRAVAAAAGYRAVQSTPLKSHKGHVLGMLSTHFRTPHRPSERDERLLDLYARHAADLIERLRSNEALRQSEERFRQLAENVNEVFWMTDPQTTQLLYISPAYERVWGRSCQSLYENPRSFMDAIHPEDRERVRADVLERQSRGEQIDKEYRVIRPDGSVRWVRDRAFPVRNAAGAFYRLVGVIDDFTERKLAEEALKEADRRKDEFLATLAHELRNPLAPIRNAVQVLRMKDPGDPQLRSARDMIDRQLRQMVRLIDDLMDVSRITRGKLQLRKERTELAAVLQSAVEASRPLLDAQAHELTVILPQGPVHLEADPIRLAQVFSNLLNNSAKYTEKGGHVWLTAERQGDGVAVSVRDTGIGIAADHLPRLFEMFSQVAPALERSQGGLGIGLALVRGLVELHGGSVEARSAGPGRGSEFTVWLPAVETAVRARPNPGGGGETSRVGPKYRILVADDLRDSAESLSIMLRLAGHDVQTAYDGVEAVQAAAAFRPGVVLLDIGMPKMNGYEAARSLRRHPWGKGVVLVALTGWGQEEDKRRTFEAGFDHHLTKPVEPAALERLLAELKPAGS